MLLGALLLALGHEPGDDLHILYGVLPLVVSFIAEQLRIGSADAILAARDYDSAADVGELPPDEQRVVVLSIVRREMGVMTIACFVVVALALRAATTSGRVLSRAYAAGRRASAHSARSPTSRRTRTSAKPASAACASSVRAV